MNTAFSEKLILSEIALMQDSNTIINNLVANLSKGQLFYKPSTDSWCILEVVCHLNDFEKIFQKRINQVLYSNYPLLFSREENAEKAARLSYVGQDLNTVLEELNLARAQSILTIQAIDPNSLYKLAKHNIYGDLSLYDIIKGFAIHDINHIKQISALLKGHSENS